MRAVRLSSSTPVLRAPGASASGMSPKKCPTPIDGSRICAPSSTTEAFESLPHTGNHQQAT